MKVGFQRRLEAKRKRNDEKEEKKRRRVCNDKNSIRRPARQEQEQKQEQEAQGRAALVAVMAAKLERGKTTP